MEFNKYQAKKFWENGTKKVEEKFEINLDNKRICEEDVKESIRRAFRDLTVRTMKKKTDNSVNGLDDLAQNCEFLRTQFKNWFQENPSKEKFDSWHEETCTKVVVFLKKHYEEKDCTIGKAQKIINMSFKNLYALCCEKGIEEEYANYFKFCHVPLDSFILEWFYRNCKTANIKKNKIASWSAILEYGKNEETYVKGEKEFYTYFFFQKEFRNCFKDITPLQAEFAIWPEIQMTLAAEAFYFAYMGIIEEAEIDKKDFKNIRLKEKIKEIKKVLEEIKDDE